MYSLTLKLPTTTKAVPITRKINFYSPPSGWEEVTLTITEDALSLSGAQNMNKKSWSKFVKRLTSLLPTIQSLKLGGSAVAVLIHLAASSTVLK